jgi:adenylate cyclase
LAQEVKGQWYLQLAFAPLMASWGNPALTAQRGRLTITGITGWGAKDLSIPLDSNGFMLLDWPLESYEDSYTHISFMKLSILEEYESHIEQYLSALGFSTRNLFPVLAENAGAILEYFAAAADARSEALEENSDAAFEDYRALRDEGLDLTREFLAGAPGYVEAESKRLIDGLAGSDPALAESIREETGYCQSLFGYIATELQAFTDGYRDLQNTLNGKTCIIGRVDTGTTDIGANPFHGKYVNVGTHAVVLDTILSRSFITPLPTLWSVVFALLFVPLIIIGIGGFRPGLRSILGVAGIILIPAVSLGLFFFKGYYLGPLGSVLAMIAAVIVREAVAFAGSEHEKQFIRKAFSTYLSADVVQEILADPEKLHLGGAKRHMSALFTDIKGFSTISEKLDPEELVSLLNNYLSAMSNVILEERGTIDKYEGDAIIAFFGAPLDLPDHALRTCVSAIMMKRVERELNTKYAEGGSLSVPPLLTRIGINTGSMVVGNMGTQQKMDYTIMGNAVNVAARLEGVNKQYGTWILASEDTIKEAGGAILSRRLDRVRVVGIDTPIRLYEVLETSDKAAPELITGVELFHQALGLFENRDWTAAAAGFEAALNRSKADTVAELYRKRCEKYRQTPPSKDWDGVFALNQK